MVVHSESQAPAGHTADGQPSIKSNLSLFWLQILSHRCGDAGRHRARIAFASASSSSDPVGGSAGRVGQSPGMNAAAPDSASRAPLSRGYSHRWSIAGTRSTTVLRSCGQ